MGDDYLGNGMTLGNRGYGLSLGGGGNSGLVQAMQSWGSPSGQYSLTSSGSGGMDYTGLPASITAMGTAPTASNGLKSWLESSGFLGSTNKDGIKTDGWGGAAIGAIGGLGSLFMGMKNYGLAKDAFNFQKEMATKNFEAQKGLINSQLEDRQRRRVAEGGPQASMSVADYMAKYGVK